MNSNKHNIKKYIVTETSNIDIEKEKIFDNYINAKKQLIERYFFLEDNGFDGDLDLNNDSFSVRDYNGTRWNAKINQSTVKPIASIIEDVA